MLWALSLPPGEPWLGPLTYMHVWVLGFCAGIPLVAAVFTRKPIHGFVAAIVTAAVAIPFPCVGGLTMGLLSAMVLVCLAYREPSSDRQRKKKRKGPRRQKPRRRRHDELEDEDS